MRDSTEDALPFPLLDVADRVVLCDEPKGVGRGSQTCFGEDRCGLSPATFVS